jgi:hypothetical protein
MPDLRPSWSRPLSGHISATKRPTEDACLFFRAPPGRLQFGVCGGAQSGQRRGSDDGCDNCARSGRGGTGPLSCRDSRGRQSAHRTGRLQPVCGRSRATGSRSAGRRRLGPGRSARIRPADRRGRVPGARPSGQSIPARVRTERPLRPPDRPGSFSPRVSRADANGDLRRAARIAMDRSGPWRSRCTGGPLLPARPDRGRARLPDHDDVCRGSKSATAAGAGGAVGAEDHVARVRPGQPTRRAPTRYRRRGPGSRTSWSVTSSSYRPRCATCSWCWRRRRGA